MKIEDLFDGTAGDDIVTVVGRGVMEPEPGRLVDYAAFVADYAECKDGLAELYTKLFDGTWNSESWAKWLKINRLSPTSVHVETTARNVMLGFEGGEQHHHEGPQFWVTADGANAQCVDEFFRLAERSTFWVLCLQTIDACYMYIVEYPGGRLLERTKRSRMEIRSAHDRKEGS